MLDIGNIRQSSFSINAMIKPSDINPNLMSSTQKNSSMRETGEADNILSTTMAEILDKKNDESLTLSGDTNGRLDVTEGNLNKAVSIVQEFHQIADHLEEQLEAVAKFLEAVANKDPMAGSDNTEFVKKMRGALQDLNITAEETPIQDNPLLGKGGHDLKISTDDGSYLVIEAEDFSMNTDMFAGSAVMLAEVYKKICAVKAYDAQLQNLIQNLSHVNTYLEPEMAKGLAADPNEMSSEFAGELASMVASQIIDNLGSNLIQDCDANRVAGLLRDPVQ